MLEETQTLERVLSPEIVSEDDNTAPSIGEFSGETGLPLVKAPWLLISK